MGSTWNKTESAVRITHLPTNIVVGCQEEKSQIKNRAKAMKALMSKLVEKQRRSEAAEKYATEKKAQVGSGDRSEKIRTYNYPQSRVTDHRINYTAHNLDQVMDGRLGDLIGRSCSPSAKRRCAPAKRPSRRQTDMAQRGNASSQRQSSLVNPTDLILFGLIIALVAFGLNILLASSSFMAREQFSDPYFFLKKQAFAAFLGFLGMLAMTQIDPDRYRHLVWPIYAISVFLLILVFVPGIGRRAGGASRWIVIGGLSVQPSDFAKVALVLALARIYSQAREVDLKLSMMHSDHRGARVSYCD